MNDDRVFRVVVGVDGSAPSRLALEWAVEEARLRNGEVQAVTAWEFPPVSSVDGVLLHDPDFFPRAAQRLQEEVLKRVESSGVTVTGEVVQGGAGAVLRREAGNADLLVVGSRGLGGFTGLLLGSVSAQLVHHSPCPVLIVRSHPRGGKRETR